jgi:hypothetical protein
MRPIQSMPSAQVQNLFFEEVLAASGLSKVIATPVVQRACARAGLQMENLRAATLRRVLPHLEATLRLYLPQQVDERMKALGALCRSPFAK